MIQNVKELKWQMIMSQKTNNNKSGLAIIAESKLRAKKNLIKSFSKPINGRFNHQTS